MVNPITLPVFFFKALALFQTVSNDDLPDGSL